MELLKILAMAKKSKNLRFAIAEKSKILIYKSKKIIELC